MGDKNLVGLGELLKKAPKIHDIINSYYHLSIKRINDEYWKQQGVRKILASIENNILNKANFEEKWQNKICFEIEKKLNLKVKGATLGMVPNYGGIVELEKDSESMGRIEIHFYVSFLKNVYSIQIVYLKENMPIARPHSGVKDFITTGMEKLVVSPLENVFFREYKIIESVIEENFENPIFLCYSIEKLRLHGLELTYMDGENCSVGEAFFHKAFPINYNFGDIPVVLGDENYKIALLQ
ncbi:hypothetical protein [Maribacter sp. 2307ULW6-5]|uniref:hypothetical protein n=1 Tax=Maribacter sp. 2307ULW6-5 TaxID=3386275 RepID=UPI0039BCEDBF